MWHPLVHTLLSPPHCLFLTQKCAIWNSVILLLNSLQRLDECVKCLSFLILSPSPVNHLPYSGLFVLLVFLLSSSKGVTAQFASDPMTTRLWESLLPGWLSKALQKGMWVTWASFTSGLSSLTPSKNWAGLPLVWSLPCFQLTDLKPFKVELGTPQVFLCSRKQWAKLCTVKDRTCCSCWQCRVKLTYILCNCKAHGKCAVTAEINRY